MNSTADRWQRCPERMAVAILAESERLHDPSNMTDPTNPPTTAPIAKAPAPAGWTVALAVVAAAIGVVFAVPLFETAKVWATKADYSHGFLVPLVAGYLVWRNRASIEPSKAWPHASALGFFLLAGAGLAAGSLNIAKEACQGLALIAAVSGLVVMFFGWKGLAWSWPAILFLVFMFPLPYTFEQNLAFKLRRIATVAANYIMQLCGQPSYIAGSGTVITVGEVKLDVQHACSGLTMLLTFVALSAAYAATVTRPWTDRLLILIMSVPIAVACNVIRIVVTGHVYVWGFKKFGDLIVHDLAGWLMMPLALAMIWAMLKLIDWVAVVPIRTRKEDFMKQNLIKDAYIRVRSTKSTEPIAPHLKPPHSSVGAPAGNGAKG
jgi:exosortase